MRILANENFPKDAVDDMREIDFSVSEDLRIRMTPLPVKTDTTP